MDEVFSKLNEDEVKTLVKYMKQAEIVASGGVTGIQPPPRLELLPVEFKLDGPATYLSWSCRIIGALAGRSLDNYITGEGKNLLSKRAMNGKHGELPTCHCTRGFSTPWFHQSPQLLMEFKV